MPSTDKRIDDYINKSAPFAIPVLTKIRALVHKGCPEVNETLKWSMPHFEYKDSILCSMASFKQHCAFGFWLSSQMNDPHGFLSITERTAMGNLGQLKSPSDLPPDKIMIAYIKEAMRLIDSGAKLSKKVSASTDKTLEIPAYFELALSKNKKAKQHFDAFPYSHRKEYIQWITEAKTEATREKRMETALEWIAEGKGRNWKYERK
jgi:uncharacterized protein YdeI (YjbR/CyaY-like superfamily)